MDIHTVSVLYCSIIAAMNVVMLFSVRRMVTEIKFCGTMMTTITSRNGQNVMLILTQKIKAADLHNIEEETYFDDMMKCVVDIDRGCMAVNADLHSDLEQMLLEDGSRQSSLYGINILFDDDSIEFDSLINPPRNRAAGYPRAGRTVADPAARRR